MMRQGLYGAFIGPLDSWDQFFIDHYCNGERPTGAKHSWLRWTNYLYEIEGNLERVFESHWRAVAHEAKCSRTQEDTGEQVWSAAAAQVPYAR